MAANQSGLLKESRERWRVRVAERREEIRKLRVKVRDLSKSRDLWKSKAKKLQQQLEAAQLEASKVAVSASDNGPFFGG